MNDKDKKLDEIQLALARKYDLTKISVDAEELHRDLEKIYFSTRSLDAIETYLANKSKEDKQYVAFLDAFRMYREVLSDEISIIFFTARIDTIPLALSFENKYIVPETKYSDEAYEKKSHSIRELINTFKAMLKQLYNAVDEKYRKFIQPIEIDLDEDHRLFINPTEDTELAELKILLRNEAYNPDDEDDQEFYEEFDLLNENHLNTVVERVVEEEGDSEYLKTALKYLENFNELKERMQAEAKKSHGYVKNVYEKEAAFAERLNIKLKQIIGYHK